MAINFIKASAAVGDVPVTAISEASSFNVNTGGQYVHGAGLQDIARVLLATHHHVDYVLFRDGGYRHGSYASYHSGVAKHQFSEKHFLYRMSEFSPLVGAGSSDQADIYQIMGTYGQNSPYFRGYLDFASWSLYGLTTGVIENSPRTPGYLGFETSEAYTDSSRSVGPVPYHWVNTSSYFDHSRRVHTSTTGSSTTLAYGSSDLFGFFGFSFFAHPLSAKGIVLAGDVNGNRTYAEHISDGTIHRSPSGATILPDVEVIGDAIMSFGGFPNIYDSTNDVVNQVNTRTGDAYPLNPFDTAEDYALERLTGGNADVAHPIKYEEGVYMWHDQTLRQFKLIKSDPDDIELLAKRRGAYPLDSLFVGAKSADMFYEGREINIAHEHFDSYFYNNYYRRDSNFEYDDSDPALSVHMWDGLGYQPVSGLMVGL